MKLEFKDQYIELGLNINYYRRKATMTQKELAEIIGIEENHLSAIETARAGASLDVVFAIAKALEIPPYKLFEFRE